MKNSSNKRRDSAKRSGGQAQGTARGGRRGGQEQTARGGQGQAARGGRRGGQQQGTARGGQEQAARGGQAQGTARGGRVRAKGGETGKSVSGVISATPKGFGFLLDPTGDYFISANNLGSACDGDTVEAVSIKGARGREARVVRVISRRADSVVGTVRAVGQNYFLSPDNASFKDVVISRDGLRNAKDGDKAVVKIVSYGAYSPVGRVKEVLGRADDMRLDTISVVKSLNLRCDFNKKTIDEAVASANAQRDTRGRVDYRSMTVVTIDGEDAKDLDDAVCVERTKGGYKLFVHIADVAEYVLANSALDKEAFKRGTSVYFPDLVLPMLPKELSNGICSLNPNVDRLTLSAEIDIDSDGTVCGFRLCEGVIKTCLRLTYTRAAELLGGSEPKENEVSAANMLPLMDELAKKLKLRRLERGSVDFELSESVIEMDDNGDVCDVRRFQRNAAHDIIEEFMLTANFSVAKMFARLELPFVFRVHKSPPPEKLEPVYRLTKALGLEFNPNPESVVSADFARLVASCPQNYKSLVNTVALRGMTKAEYSAENLGHFGLAAKYYCHFTSPIRRYPDLMIHRIIKAFLRGGASETKAFAQIVSKAASESSLRERTAEAAEREVDNIKKVRFATKLIGKEFDAVISGVCERGFFAELENTIEGMVRLTSLPLDDYSVDADLIQIKGNKNVFKCGDKIRVIVDVFNGKVAFNLA